MCDHKASTTPHSCHSKRSKNPRHQLSTRQRTNRQMILREAGHDPNSLMFRAHFVPYKMRFATVIFIEFWNVRRPNGAFPFSSEVQYGTHRRYHFLLMELGLSKKWLFRKLE